MRQIIRPPAIAGQLVDRDGQPVLGDGQPVVGERLKRAVTGGPPTLVLDVAPLRLSPRADGPAIVHPLLVAQCMSFRDACRLGYYLRRKGLTLRSIAAATGMHAPHMSDYLGHDDDPSRRDMPARYIGRYQAAVGNAAVAQWVAMAANLTVAEERRHFGE